MKRNHPKFIVVMLLSIGIITSCSSKFVKESTVPWSTTVSEPEAARIVFLLPQGGMGPIEVPVVSNNRMIGCLTKSSYFVYDFPAGNQEFVLFGPYATEAVMGEFEAGKVYYVQVRIFYGTIVYVLHKGHPRWEDSMTWLEKKGTRVELVQEEADEWDAEHAVRVAEKTEQYRQGLGTPEIVGPEAAN